MRHASYLSYLKQKERKLIISALKITHGHLSTLRRCAKGYLLGFGLANIMLSVNRDLNSSVAALLGLSLLLSTLFIKYQLRQYKRESLINSTKKAMSILALCALSSLLVLVYSNIFGYILVLATTNLFVSLAYSFE